VFAVVLAIGYAVAQLAGSDWDPTLFTAFGEEDMPTREFAEERLGQVLLRPEWGHDGRSFFVQANDPWVLSPETHAAILDRPLYRSQRMLYPMVAGGLGLFPPRVIVWTMIIVNVLALGVGTWAVGSIATSLGGTSWWGLAFLLNLGFTSEMNIGGAGVLAGALAFSAVALLLKEKLLPAVVLFTLAALSREVMLITAIGSAAWLWTQGRRRDASLVGLVPLAVVATWAAYLRWRITTLPPVDQVEDSLGLPFAGIARAFQSWLSDPLDMVVGFAMLLLLFLFAWRTLKDRHLIAFAFVGFVPLALLLTEPIWRNYFDLTRAIAPVITAFLLVAFVAAKQMAMRAASRPNADSPLGH
jgi:hypothetical protein